MTYVQSTLTPGEQVIYRGYLSIWAMAPRITIGTFLMLFGVMFYFSELQRFGVGCFALGLVAFATAVIAYRTTELAITSKRVVAKFGVIRRRTVELTLARIESVQVKQSILGRLFDYGSLIVAGAGVPSAPVPGISDPMSFRRAVFASLETNDKPDLKLVA